MTNKDKSLGLCRATTAKPAPGQSHEHTLFARLAPLAALGPSRAPSLPQGGRENGPGQAQRSPGNVRPPGSPAPQGRRDPEPSPHAPFLPSPWLGWSLILPCGVLWCADARRPQAPLLGAWLLERVCHPCRLWQAKLPIPGLFPAPIQGRTIRMGFMKHAASRRPQGIF